MTTIEMVLHTITVSIIITPLRSGGGVVEPDVEVSVDVVEVPVDVVPISEVVVVAEVIDVVVEGTGAGISTVTFLLFER